MNIHHLELFYYVARHGGIVPAVRNMPYGIQQPAVSGQIARLEESLGTKLFNRRPFALLPPGIELYEFIAQKFGETFPAGTLFVNISGSLIIGFFAALTGPDGRIWLTPSFRQFFMIGVLGGYTTFSSFSLQTLALAHDGEWLFAALNAIGSFVLCLFAVWLGDYFAVLLNQR